jgi:hypothetical protein
MVCRRDRGDELGHRHLPGQKGQKVNDRFLGKARTPLILLDTVGNTAMSPKQARYANPAPRAGPKLPRWVIGLTFVALAGAGTYAVLHFFILTRVPHGMLGTWVVMDVKTTGRDKSNEALKGGRMYFYRDGRMVVEANMDGKGYTIKATVEVDGDEMRIITVNPNNGQTATDVHTIRTLEGDRFVVEDSKGTTFMMERLRE